MIGFDPSPQAPYPSRRVSETNCPNCGAPIDPLQLKCPYCGTRHLDLTVIPTKEPFYLSINVGTNEAPEIIRTKVMTTGANFKQESERLYGRDGMSLVGVYMSQPEIELSFKILEDNA